MTYDTNPHGKSSAEIEREIAEERASLDRDVHTLQDQMSVGALFDRFAGSAANESGALARNLGAQIRDNPLPAAMIGIGVAWLMSGRGGPQARVNYGYSRDAMRDPYYRDDFDDYDPYYAAAADGGQVGIPYGDVDPDMEGNDARSVIGGEGMGDTGSGPGMHERAKSGVHAAGASAKAGAQSAGDSARAGAHRAGDAARSGAAGVSRAAGSAASGVGHAARSGASGVGYAARSGAAGVGYAARSGAAGMGYAARSAAGYARSGADEASEAFYEHPLAAGALALAAGALLGALVPNSRRENELMGEQADEARRYARGEIDRNLDRAERAAGAMADEARHMGEEARESVEGQARKQDGRQAVDAAEAKAREGADRIKKAGEAEWNKDDDKSKSSTGSTTPGTTAASTPGTTKPGGSSGI